MRTLPLALVLVAAAMTLGACTAEAPAPTPTATTTSSPSATSTEASATEEGEEPVAPRADDAPPTVCVDAVGQGGTVDEGGAAIAAAAANAALPTAVVLAPGVDVVASASRAGLFDVTADVCSQPLPRSALIAVANEVALAIAADPSSAQVGDLVVTGWVPADDGTLEESLSVRTDFPAHTWQRGSARPLSSNWE